MGLQSFRLTPTLAVLMRGIRYHDRAVVTEWHGGFRLYQLQSAAAPNGAWQDCGAPTESTSSTNAVSDVSRFFRVIALP